MNLETDTSIFKNDEIIIIETKYVTKPLKKTLIQGKTRRLIRIIFASFIPIWLILTTNTLVKQEGSYFMPKQRSHLTSVSMFMDMI